MADIPPWRRNEKEIVSITDYNSVEEARAYDERMCSVRNVAAENKYLLSLLSLPAGARVLEIGTGTGAFARAASMAGLNVTALDVSPVMLAYAKEKTAQEGWQERNGVFSRSAECMTGTIQFVQDGFLSYSAGAKTFDAVVSSLCLHHLSDVWKAEACVNIWRWLKLNGKFVLVDVVYDCEGGQLDSYLSKYIPANMNESMKLALYGHIQKENSTFEWIMREILLHAGFLIHSVEPFGPIAHVFTCVKV